MMKHKCNKCNKEATVIEHGKYLCSQHGREYVFSSGYNKTNIKERVINSDKIFRRVSK